MPRTQPENNLLRKLGMSVLLLTVTLLLAACGQQAADFESLSATPQSLDELATRTRLRTFNAIWKTLDENYLYANSDVVDLPAIEAEYRERITSATDYDSFQEIISEMFAEFPEGTVIWQTREERIQAEVNSSATSNHQGIGAVLTFRPEPEPHLVVISITASSSAEFAGLEARDSIYALNGEAFSDTETAEEIEARLRGTAGSTFMLTVQSPGEERRGVEITLGPIQSLPNRLQATFYENGNILYLAFPRFGYADLSLDLLTHIEGFGEDKDIEGVIFDLRIAASGSSWPIDELLSLFMGGDIGESFTSTDSTPISIAAEDFFNSQEWPVAVLIGPDTQGVPELFAASLQAAEEGLVIGLPSAANLETEVPFYMPDGSQLSVTTASFVTTEGLDIGMNGVTPDILVDLYWETQVFESDEVINAAIDALNNEGS